MLYLLGILTGLLIAVICMLSIRRYQTKIERVIKQVGNKFREKGEVFVDSDEKQDFEAFLENLPKE